MNLSERIRAVTDLDHQAEALLFERQSWTWGDVAMTIGELDAALTSSGAGPGSEVAVADLLAHLRPLLAPYELPRQIRIVDRLPRTTSLKVHQPALRELFAD